MGKFIKYGLLAVVVIAISLFVAAWLLLEYYRNSAEYHWRNKITVEVQTPDGLVSGSSVHDITVKKGLRSVGGRVPKSNMKLVGEAVVVELPNDQYLFALLKPANNRVGAQNVGDILTRIAAPNEGARTHPGLEISDHQPVGAAFTVPERYYPLLVSFDNINDPQTVKQVDPNNLVAIFGGGYALKSITLEITDEPVTNGKVESVFSNDFFRKWASIHNTALSDGGVRNSYFDTFASKLSKADFSKGESQ